MGLRTRIQKREGTSHVKDRGKMKKFKRRDYENYFFKVTGFYPYDYQIKVAEDIVDRNLLINASTGSGKTFAALSTFLFYKQKEKFQRMIYALPTRILVNTIHETICESVKKKGLDLKVTIQTGEIREDPNFEGDIIVTTIDQLFISYLTLKNNINYGAFIGSLIIIDEVHLLERDKAFLLLRHISENKDVR
jgi:CRISPR-associated endonuclease/helicase Cas3